jgi:hypothetical protein
MSVAANTATATLITLQNDTADFSQSGYEVAKTTDGSTTSGNGWAYHPQLSTDHFGAWETATDLGQSNLTFTVIQNQTAIHTLRKLRFSVTQSARDDFADGGSDPKGTAAWSTLTPLTATQLGGTPTINGDKSISFPKTTAIEEYTVTATTPFGGITGILLEVFADPQVGYSDTGGNAVLTEFVVDATAVPEPSAALLAALGLLGLALCALRRRK